MARNGTKKPGLTPRQLKVIEILLKLPNVTQAAKASGVSVRTIFRWLNEPTFSEAYRSARERLLEDTVALLRASGAEAVMVLRSIMLKASASDAVRISAARSLLEFDLKHHEQFEIDQRLHEIEERFGITPASIKGAL